MLNEVKHHYNKDSSLALRITLCFSERQTAFQTDSLCINLYHHPLIFVRFCNKIKQILPPSPPPDRPQARFRHLAA